MALGFKEKRQLQKTAKSALDALQEAGIGFKRKRELQKELKGALEALGVLGGKKPDAPEPEIKPEPTPENGGGLLAQLVAGDFDSLGVKAYRDKMAEAFAESGDVPDALEQIRAAGFAYLKSNKKQLTGSTVFESVKKNS